MKSPDTAIDLAAVERIVADIGSEKKNVIPILQMIQKQYGYLPADALNRVCEISEITPAVITGVSTFYTQFRHTPVGKHTVHVCIGTACHVKGAGLVVDALHRFLKIPNSENTDPEKKFTIEKVACLGCCTLAPVVQIDNVTYGHITPEKVPSMLQDFLTRQTAVSGKSGSRKDNNAPVRGEIRIGQGSCCVASGSLAIRDAIEKTIPEIGCNVKIKQVGCVGMCHQVPLLEVVTEEEQTSLYVNVKPEDVRRILLRHFKPKGVLRSLALSTQHLMEDIYCDSAWEGVERYVADVRDGPVASFLDPQVHLATDQCGVVEPTDIDEYKRNGGFKALQRAFKEMRPEEVVETVISGGLRGRGGGGFPTGAKWSLVQAAESRKKYVVCNGDEGDPGAFMDRMLLESFPFRIIEGMMIAAYAVGADEAYFYIRAEYPLAVARIREALALVEKEGLTGDNILGTGFSLKFNIMEGAGAFVCGEETALIASIEGNRGMPRIRPPFPAAKGLWESPTLVNNVETYSLIPAVILDSTSFAKLGTEKSKGTKVFALAGKIRRGGLIEVPMGISLQSIVDTIGGGIAGDKKLKAVQVGGPSGGCIPAHMARMPVDYEKLTEAGAMMGSGGLVVLDESDCMVDIARYFLSFTQDQSCGKCTFCRIGTRRMLDILQNLCTGKGKKGDIEKLENLAVEIKEASLCGLGKTAPNPVLSTLHYFREEYEAHIAGVCPAKKCPDIIQYRVNDFCIGCTRCAQRCPAEAIVFSPYKKHEIMDEKCTRCTTCLQVCPKNAIEVVDRA